MQQKEMAMLKFFTPILLSAMLVGCFNPELDECKSKASKLWDNSSLQKHKDGNKAYWRAIKRCEKKHG